VSLARAPALPPGSVAGAAIPAYVRGALLPGHPSAARAAKIKTAVRVGRAYEQIIQQASATQADLVIMAVQGRNLLDLAVFGSTTYRVIQLASCSVLAVHG